MLLDIGCGSGLSGETLTEQGRSCGPLIYAAPALPRIHPPITGHVWFGIDISEAMLDVAKEREVDGDLALGDIGHGLPGKESLP